MSFKLQYLDKVPQEGNAFSDYGTFSHLLLENWAKGKLPSIALAEKYEDDYDQAVSHSFPPFPRGMAQKYYDAGLEYFQSFDGFGDSFEILSVEKKFQIDIGGYPFVGIADLILLDKETGEIVVIDHKSKSMASMKKEITTYRRQLYTYAAHVKETYGVYPSKLIFNMFKEGTTIEEVFSMDFFNDTMQWIISSIENILFETEWRVCTSSYFCRYVCSVLDYCPAREAVLYPPKKGSE